MSTRGRDMHEPDSAETADDTTDESPEARFAGVARLPDHRLSQVPQERGRGSSGIRSGRGVRALWLSSASCPVSS